MCAIKIPAAKLRFIIVLSACIAGLSACATPDPELGMKFEPVQTYRSGDPKLSCANLKKEIDDLDYSIRVLDKQIQNHTNVQASNSFGSTLSQVMGQLGGTQSSYNSAAINNAMYQGMSQQTSVEMNKKNTVLNSHQKRRDVLMQQYYAKRCK